MQFEEYKPTLDKLLAAAEQSAVQSVKLTEQISNISGRIDRLERGQEAIIASTAVIDSPIHRMELCPHKQKFEEYDRVVFGDEGLQRQINSLQRSLSYYKGAVWIMSGILAIVFPLLIWELVAILQHLAKSV